MELRRFQVTFVFEKQLEGLLEHPAGAPLATHLVENLREKGVPASGIENWRDVGWEWQCFSDRRWMYRVEGCISLVDEVECRWLLDSGYRMGVARLFRDRSHTEEVEAVAAALDSILMDDVAFKDVRWYTKYPAMSRRHADEWTTRPPL